MSVKVEAKKEKEYDLELTQLRYENDEETQLSYENGEENQKVVVVENFQNKVKKRYSQQFRRQWLEDPNNKDWLRRIEGNTTKCFCKYCNTKITAKLSDIEKHRNTRKHKNAQEEYYSLKNYIVNESLSDEDLYNESLHEAFRMDSSFRDDIGDPVSYEGGSSEYCFKRLKSGEVKKFPIKQELFYPADSYVTKEEDEIDSFAKSIAAQMKMLREEDTIELTFEIQNLVTQRRRKLMEAKLAEKQVESNESQQEVITVSIDHSQLSSVSNQQ